MQPELWCEVFMMQIFSRTSVYLHPDSLVFILINSKFFRYYKNIHIEDWSKLVLHTHMWKYHSSSFVAVVLLYSLVLPDHMMCQVLIYVPIISDHIIGTLISAWHVIWYGYTRLLTIVVCFILDYSINIII